MFFTSSLLAIFCFWRTSVSSTACLKIANSQSWNVILLSHSLLLYLFLEYCVIYYIHTYSPRTYSPAHILPHIFSHPTPPQENLIIIALVPRDIIIMVLTLFFCLLVFFPYCLNMILHTPLE